MRIAIVLTVLSVLVGCSENQTAIADTAATSSAASVEKGTSEDSFDVGDAAPAFKGLQGVDDERHSLKDYAEAKAVVIAFICNHCPVAVAYEDRLNALQKDYAGKGVQLIAINVNNLEADRLPAMKERAEAKGFQFPYLYDPSQEVGREFGATVTPHVFLLDQQRKLAFVGPIDDNMVATSVSEQYLREAIDAVLAGKSPQTSSKKPFGCGIKYE